MVEPDIQVSLRKIDPLTGGEKWNVSFPTNQRPYRCEAYTNRIVVFLYTTHDRNKWLKSKVIFLDSKTGRTVAPFDTRDFVYGDDDPQLTRSRDGSQGSILDERGEIWLPNGWVSHGVSRLPWWNAGTNQIYFFDRYHWELKWSLTLPEGAYNLSHWSNVLVFRKGIKKDNKRIGILYGQPAGRNSPIWEFALPADVPDVSIRTFDVVGPPTISRDFTYTVGKQEIYVFGGGTLFALGPDTGKTLWRYNVSGDPALKKKSIQLDYADVLEMGDDLILSSGTTLARFNKKPRSAVAVIRNDLHDNPLPISCDGFVYCFTER
jgi:outer membrane protein assembly factor BamB